MIELTPLKMHPCYKEYLWGGKHLKSDYGKLDAPNITAESWELAVHSDGISLIENGIYAGKSLAELRDLDKDAFLGRKCSSDVFPILVKLIDAEKDLSIQVHPSDETADQAAGEKGKAEMWYIVDCKPHSYIYFGLSKYIQAEEIAQRSKNGTICEVLNKVPVKKGDVFYVLPGTIHAICAGIQIAEIQQNSNTTFRLYDYQRKDANGNERPLHLDRAIEVVSYEPIIPQECKANSKVYFPGYSMTEMFSCRYFRAFRIDVEKAVKLYADGDSFQHLLCVEGRGEIVSGERCWSFRRGDSYFIPADLGEYTIEGQCRILMSRT